MSKEKFVEFKRIWSVSQDDMDNPIDFYDDEKVKEIALKMYNEESSMDDLMMYDTNIENIRKQFYLPKANHGWIVTWVTKSEEQTYAEYGTKECMMKHLPETLQSVKNRELVFVIPPNTALYAEQFIKQQELTCFALRLNHSFILYLKADCDMEDMKLMIDWFKEEYDNYQTHDFIHFLKDHSIEVRDTVIEDEPNAQEDFWL